MNSKKKIGEFVLLEKSTPRKRLLYRGLFQVCAKQKCPSVSNWFDIILIIHMPKHMRVFLSKLKVF